LEEEEVKGGRPPGPRGGGGGGALKESFVCCRGLQTLTLFKAKSVHFATPFKTVEDKRPLYFTCVLDILSALFFISHTESIFFIKDILE